MKGSIHHHLSVTESDEPLFHFLKMIVYTCSNPSLIFRLRMGLSVHGRLAVAGFPFLG